MRGRSIRDPKYARLKRKTNEDDKSGSAVVSPVKTRRTTLDTSFNRTEDPSSSLPKLDDDLICILCDNGGGRYWRRASTLGLDKRVRLAATSIGDHSLIAKLSNGDMIAIESVYHAQC